MSMSLLQKHEKNSRSHHESKLLMRTDAVRMFFVHYVTQLEFPFQSYDPVAVDVNDVALLHYKIAPIATGDIWGQQYIERNWSMESPECLIFKRFGGYKEDIKNGYYRLPDQQSTSPRKYFIQNIGVNIQNVLAVKYLGRMFADEI